MEEKTLYIDEKTNKMVNELCHKNCNESTYEKYNVRNDEIIYCDGIEFGDGMMMDVRAVSCQDGEPCWCEAILFKLNGSVATEVGCTDVCDTLVGEWVINDYKVTVKEKKEFKDGDVIYFVFPQLDEDHYSITFEKNLIDFYIEEMKICDSDIQDDGYIEYDGNYFYPDSSNIFYNRKDAIEYAKKETMERIDNLRKGLMGMFNEELEKETNN